jgi:hypothetical protein
MARIVGARHVENHVLELELSDGSSGGYDLAPLVARDTVLTRPLKDRAYFLRFYLEAGGLCWPNGLELDPEAIRRRLDEQGLLRSSARVA